MEKIFVKMVSLFVKMQERFTANCVTPNKRTLLYYITAMMLVLLLFYSDTYALDDLSDRRAATGDYSSTIGEMAAKRLHVYGFWDKPALGKILLAQPSRLDAMLLLHRAFGEKTAETQVFTDVSQEYTEPVAWGVTKGITQGVGDHQFGNGPLSEQQCYVWISRLLGWNTEDAGKIQALMEENRLTSPQRREGQFTWADLLLIVCEVLDHAYPERCIPHRQTLSAPKEIRIAADSSESAIRQLDCALYFLPRQVRIEFPSGCPRSDLAAFDGWLSRTNNLIFQMATDPEYSQPYTVLHPSTEEYLIQVNAYSQAYSCNASVQNYMRVFEDTEYAAILREFFLRELFPLKSTAKSKIELITSVHDLIIDRACYDYAEFDQKTRTVLGIHPSSHKVLGFFSGEPFIVCDGFSNTLAFSLVSLHIPCFMVISQGHAWNRVVVDGNELNIDTTWDDLVTDRHRFLLRNDTWWREYHSPLL